MDVKEIATKIIIRIVNEGYIAYFAGGWVRDFLLDHPSSDIDIATNAPIQVILDLFPHTILVGLAFGVVIVVELGHQFEVATFRTDINYTDGRKPQQIELATPQEDAHRRDFTINGMFYDPLTEIIYDFVGGVEDLNKGIIRAIGNPYERFIEDRLRMIRAIRFACRFGFAIDQETQDAIAENADTLFPAIAMERISLEFNKMAESSHFDHALIELHRLRLLAVIFPVLQEVHLNDIKHQVASFEHYPKNCPTILHLLVLFPNISLDDKLDICRMLKLSTREMNLVILDEQCRKLEEQGHAANLTDWMRFYSNPNSAIILETYAARLPQDPREVFLERHKLCRESYQQHIERIINRTPLVNAMLLKAHGIPDGKLMGTLLKEAESIAICQDLKDPLVLLDQLKKLPLWPLKPS